jgi:HK97 family phage portal protein
MTLRNQISHAWHRLTGVDAASAETAQRKTTPLPAILSPYTGSRTQNSTPKPTPANLRKFAETPVARRATNLVKDKIACMDWSVRLRRGYTATDVPDASARIHALRCALAEPNASDSFRTLFEQVLEDLLVGGMGAIEMESTGDDAQPFRLYPVDGATIEIDLNWNGDPAQPRYAQSAGQLSARKPTPLLDSELMYLRLNPRTHTPFGLGRLEVAFETINQFLAANKYAGRLASNSVVQYALWLNEATPEQHDRLIRWWQDEIEGTGRVPILSCEQKPEVLRFAGGTDADLRLAWQEFLLRIIANAFDLPPMLLGLQSDVNLSTAGEQADEAFRSAIVPVARLLAEHISRDLFAKRLGWREFEFVFNDLESRDEMQELQIQTELLKAGVLTIDEVREIRGLPRRTEDTPPQAPPPAAAH